MTERPGLTSRDAHHIADWQIILPFAAIVALQAVGAFFVNNNTWGFNFWSLLPRRVALSAISLYIVSSIPSVSHFIATLATQAWLTLRRFLKGLPQWSFWAVAAVSFLAASWFFRSQAPIYGDGYYVVSESSRTLSQCFSDSNDFRRPLTVLVYYLPHLVLGKGNSIPPLELFSFMSVLGGAIGLLGLVAIVRTLSRIATARAILFLAAISGGATLLMLGYVEYNVWPIAGLLWLLAAGLKYRAKRWPLWSVLALAVVAVLFNVMLAPVALTVMAAVFIGHRALSFLGTAQLQPRRIFLLVGLGATICGALLHFIAPTFTVPIVPTATNPYWVLSPRHLLDIVNAIVLLAPIALVAMPLYFAKSSSQSLENPYASLLALASWAGFLVAFQIDPKLGAASDWDLLSLFGFPLSLLSGYVLLGLARTVREQALVLVQLSLIVPLLVGPSIYEKLSLTENII